MIRVLIVDDSRLVRELLSAVLSADPTIEVVGSAADPFEAREMIKRLDPDVITLDIEMPRMDGITFLKNLMRLRPMPVVMISTLTEKGADITVEALELGAVDFIPKPKLGLQEGLSAIAEEIQGKIKLAAKVDVAVIEENFRWQETLTEQRVLAEEAKGRVSDSVRLVAIGASTGGPEAVKKIITELPGQMPPIAVVLHMPAGFTESFARRLNKFTPLTVTELPSEQTELRRNHVYIAYGDRHMLVRSVGDKIIGVQDDQSPVHRHKPAVDVLFDSVARELPGAAVGVLLTGMGIDGANGLKQLLDAGCTTIAQDKKSSVVWGMPRVAAEMGAAQEILPLAKIAQDLKRICYE